MKTHNTPTAGCSQEPRLAHLEAIQTGILENLKDMKTLLVNSIKSEERISALQQDRLDQEKRLRRLELTQATGKWMERVAWAVVTAGLGLLFKFGGQGMNLSTRDKAGEDELAELHGLLTEEFSRRVKSKEASPSDLNAIRQFLRDNNITCDGPRSPKMRDLADGLPDELPEYPQ